MTDKPEDTTETLEPLIPHQQLIRLLATVYGPYAFGLLALLMIWWAIVSPQLERQALDFKQLQGTIDVLKEISVTQHEVADTMERTAATQEVVSRTLEKTAETLQVVLNGRP